MLQQARQLCGPSPVLDLVERDYSNSAGEIAGSIQLDSLPEVYTAWEHYAIGCWLMHHRLFAEAGREFAEAVDLQPDEFWAHFQQTRCDFELAHFEQALTSATVCIALAPKRAECFYNRGLCYESLVRHEDALADFGRALQLDPTFAPAAFA